MVVYDAEKVRRVGIDGTELSASIIGSTEKGEGSRGSRLTGLKGLAWEVTNR